MLETLIYSGSDMKENSMSQAYYKARIEAAAGHCHKFTLKTGPFANMMREVAEQIMRVASLFMAVQSPTYSWPSLLLIAGLALFLQMMRFYSGA